MPVTEDWLRKFQREVKTLSGPFIQLCWRCQDHGMTAKNSSKSGVECLRSQTNCVCWQRQSKESEVAQALWLKVKGSRYQPLN